MEEFQIPITEELKEICREIVNMRLSEPEWAAIESDDMFQKDFFVGGYDATENAFTLSYLEDNKEYWFQLTLEEVSKINEGKTPELQGRLADTSI
jgi:predicted PP-loop superfamily ATPase